MHIHDLNETASLLSRCCDRDLVTALYQSLYNYSDLFRNFRLHGYYDTISRPTTFFFVATLDLLSRLLCPKSNSHNYTSTRILLQPHHPDSISYTRLPSLDDSGRKWCTGKMHVFHQTSID
jgi:hypothetical protein